LAAFIKFGKAKNQKFVLSLQEIMGGHETAGAGAKLGGAVPSGPGLKPPLQLFLSVCLSVCLA